MDLSRQKEFDRFWVAVQRDIHGHPVIVANPYCKWFKKGQANQEQIIDLFGQFAVFSKWFLLAQMMRMLNAIDLEGETRARYILVNELGVETSPNGHTENLTFKTEWAHINWLRKTAEPLKLDAVRLGSWESASASTKNFIEGLEATYGNKDGRVGRGASYAIETWAAWGIGKGERMESENFWKELIAGIDLYNQGKKPESTIPLDFFRFHFENEKGHGDNVLEELRSAFEHTDFDKQKFLSGGKQALEAIYTFWLGLDQARQDLSAKSRKPRMTEA